MAVALIRPQTANALVTLNSVEYKQFMSYAGLTAQAPEIDDTVFSNENVGGEFSIGTERLSIDLRGIMKRGATGAGPLMPLSSFQNMPYVVQFDDGCNVTGTCNLMRAGAYRAAGSTGTIDGQAVGVGTYVKAWNLSS